MHVVYSDFETHFSDPIYLRNRAILKPTNEVADEINSFVLARVPGDEMEYLSCDSISRSVDTTDEADLLYPMELLNSIDANNFPQLRLILKIGVSIMLLRNINESTGLCNGTRVTSRNGLKILIENEDGTCGRRTKKYCLPRDLAVSSPYIVLFGCVHCT